MNNNNQFSQAQPYSFPVPFVIGGSQQNTADLLDNDAPARVKVALEFLTQITVKQMPRAAANDLTIEWATMPKLTANEVSAQGAACSLLIEYFTGNMKPDGWEAMRKKAATNGVVPSKKPGTLLRCFGCAPEFTENCAICANKRTIMVYPNGD